MIEVEKRVYDLGTIKHGEKYIIKYKIKNIGKSTLQIDSAMSSCDCTVANISKKEILPNDYYLMEVEFTPVDTGFFDKKVVIKSNVDSVFSIVSFKGYAKP
jgi:hypothetical protein